MMNAARHPNLNELEAELDAIRGSPAHAGVVELIVRRPAAGEREVLGQATLDPAEGLTGDNWRARGSTSTPDGSPNPARQLTIMNARAADAVALDRDRWPLAGDQLYVDFDLSAENLPPGTRLAVGSAIVEVSSAPHLGCEKFKDRFGPDAFSFVNSSTGKALRLRGLNARVVQAGVVRVGETVRKA